MAEKGSPNIRNFVTCVRLVNKRSKADRNQDYHHNGSNTHKNLKTEPGTKSGASHRVRLLVQLCHEHQRDPSFAKELKSLAGSATSQAAADFARSVNAIHSLASLVPTPSPFSTSGFPTIPPGCAYPDPVPNPLPPLPPILSPELETLVFTHRGTILGTSAGMSAAYVAMHSYERLEFLGDAYLEAIASRLLYHHFPADHEGQLSATRQGMLSNADLAPFSIAYGFDERVQLTPEYALAGGQDQTRIWTKVLGDLFESYVAAIILSDPENGFETAEKWMAALWEPRMRKHAQEVPLRETAKNELRNKITSRGVNVDYRLERPPESIKGGVHYTIGLYVTGWGWRNEKLAEGQAEGKTDAGIRAAMLALENPLVVQMGAIKRTYDELVRQAREEEGGPNQEKLKELYDSYMIKKS